MFDLDTLIAAADKAKQYLAEQGRADDPHRFATLASEFDDGKAARVLAIEFMGPTKRRVGLQLWGTKGGEEKILEVAAVIAERPRETSH